MRRLKDIKERINNKEALKKIIFQIFYASPIEGCADNLAEGLRRYILGLPLQTPEEIQQDFLNSLTYEERSEWHRRNNAIGHSPTDAPLSGHNMKRN